MTGDPSDLKRPYAALTWRGADPIATGADDVYFSAENGLEEARAVFLAGAGFPDRFARGVTVVGELGFGTGLNFLALWDSFRRCAAPDARLHFVSVEGFPLARTDAARALRAFPEIAPLAEALIAAWPAPHKGAHRRVFEHGRITLTVFHDEADAALSQTDFAADAWFLDGFAPAKNPDMWTASLFAQLARLSKPGAPAATFTVAGVVRRGLAGAGFAVEKKPGFARKRERLEAIFDGAPTPARVTAFPAPAPRSGPIAVVGGGVAAASLVEAFARRGRTVQVFADGGWGSGASGAPRGLLTPRLEVGDRPHNRALLAAFDYARQLYENRQGFEASGVLRLAGEGAGLDRLERMADLLDEGFLWCDAEAAQGRTGADGGPGLWMARSGAFEPAALVADLAGGLEVRDERVERLELIGEGAAIYGVGGRLLGAFETVILAGGHAGAPLVSGLSLEATAGRVGVFDGEAPRAPVAWGGYAAPWRSRVLIGATHVKQDAPEAEAEAEKALRTLAETGPLAIEPGAMTDSWGGVRAAAKDRLPVAGLLPGSGFEDRWRAAARGGAAPSEPEPADGALLALTGFGARGFAHAPLLAEALASALSNEPAPLQRDGLEALHPARFSWRALKKG